MPLKQFEFGDEQAEALERTAKAIGESQVYVVREGIRIFRLAVGAARKSGKLQIVYPNGNTETLVGPWSDVMPAA